MAADRKRGIILNFAGADKKPSAEIRGEQHKGHRRGDVERGASADFGIMMTSRPSAYALCFQTTITIKRGRPECCAKEVLWYVTYVVLVMFSPFTVFPKVA